MNFSILAQIDMVTSSGLMKIVTPFNFSIDFPHVVELSMDREDYPSSVRVSDETGPCLVSRNLTTL